jgi:hypothetical protein
LHETDAAAGPDPGGATITPAAGTLGLTGYAPTVERRPVAIDTQRLGSPTVLLRSAD